MQEDKENIAQEAVENLPVSSKSWLAEIQAALKREKDWRESAKRAIDRYTNAKSDYDTEAGNFNILWSNTELLRNAVYNQPPAPDIRQRWAQKDPLSLAVSQVLDRAMEYVIDVSNFDATVKRSILDFLLPGRSVIRVRYDPEIVKRAGPDGTFYDEVASENVIFESVSYKDFVCHDAPDWNRCEWIAFRHYIIKAEAVELFPEYAEQLSYFGEKEDELDGDYRESEDHKPDEHTDMDAKALVWEIWDRRTKSVIWVAKGIPVALKRTPPPLNLSGFYPVAMPLIGVPSPDKLMPTTIFSQYEKQADELDLLTDRIHKTAGIVKWHGFYDASLGAELESLFSSADDGDLVPTSSSTIVMERGGFSNMIWLFPIEEAVKVLDTLYASREKVKDTIYEITGISDILRGVSNQYETASAQKIKAAWGGSRVDGYKREIQRFLADTLRIAAEVVAENYAIESLIRITGLNYPMAEEKQQWEAQLQELEQKKMMMQQMLQQQMPQGQVNPVADAAQGAMEQLNQQSAQLKTQLEIPCWQEISDVLHSDLTRSYKINIETDSTIAPNYQQDMQDLQMTMQAIGMFGQQFLPAVKDGICPPKMFTQILYSLIKKTPLANDMTPAFDEFMNEAGMVNPFKEELEKTKKELENAKLDHDIKEKELDIKARELKQKGLLEAKKVDLQNTSMGNQNEAAQAKLELEKAKIAAEQAAMMQPQPLV